MNQETQLATTYKAEVNIYEGASMLKVTEQEQSKLLSDFDETLIEIRPDGLIYLPQTFWRQRLNETFGIGQWCLVPKGSTKDESKNKCYLQGVMMIRGVFVAEAVGEAEYHESNPNQSWASVWESAKSDCITRCCKDLGIASKLWQPQFSKAWVEKNAVQVWREKTGKKKNGESGSFQWRKKTAPKFYDEKGGEQTKLDVKKEEPSGVTKAPKAEKPMLIKWTNGDKKETTKEWKNTVEKLMDGKVTLETVKSVYCMSEQTEKELTDISNSVSKS